MAETRTEEQILDAFMKGSPGLSEEPSATEQQPKAAQQQSTGTENAQVEGQDAPEQEQSQAPDPQDSAETETIEIDPDEPLFEQEIEEAGQKKKQKLSLKELQQGYLRQADYTRKTQELAKQRDELPKVTAKQVQELGDAYAKRLSELNAFVSKVFAPELQNVDWNRLSTEDPFEYIKLQNRRQQVVEMIDLVKKEQDAASTKLAQEQQSKKASEWQKSLEVLTKDIPNFGPEIVKGLVETGRSYGFTDEDMAEWRDHRLLKMVYDIGNRKQIESKRPEVEKKVAVVTKILKPGAKQASRSSYDQARQQLRKTGKPADALPVFEAMVG